MSTIPDGAQSVTYHLGYPHGEPEIQLTFTGDLSGHSPQERHAAFEAAAEGMAAHLQQVFPDGNLVASRTFTGAVSGDPWPAS
jgi:hypothetical protein